MFWFRGRDVLKGMATHLSPTMVSRKLLALGFIKEYIGEHEVGPSYGEIAAGIGIGNNREGVRKLVLRLAEQGLIIKRPGHRGISLPGTRDEALRRLQDDGWTVCEISQRLTPPDVTNPPLPLLAQLDDIPDV